MGLGAATFPVSSLSAAAAAGMLAVALTFSLPADAQAAPAVTERGVEEANPLIVELLLDKERLSDVLTIYEVRNDFLLPVGELSSLLTIGITVDPANRIASGFILDPENLFRLDYDKREILFAGKSRKLDAWQVQFIDGELYLARDVLQQALPVDFSLDLSTLRMEAHAREKLPVQLKLQRERDARLLNQGAAAVATPLYPRLPNRYGLIGLPFIDTTLTAEARKSGKQVKFRSSLSTSFSSDLLGMEAAGFLNYQTGDPKPRGRITLGRHDPEGHLLGPLGARSFEMGDVILPAVRNVLTGAGGGAGVVISNRPLNQGNSYGLQTLRGPLQPGWDVTLYINDALVAFQTSRPDGTYEFRDLNLNYGRTEFSLVFNGPLGERRVERQAFQLDQTLTRPGELFYTLGGKQEDGGVYRYVGQIDFGLMRNAALAGSVVTIDDPENGKARYYLAAGLRAAAAGALFNTDYTRDLAGGDSLEIGVRTTIFGLAIDAARTWINGYSPDLQSGGSAPKLQDRILLNGNIVLSDTLRLPVALDARREVSRDGETTATIQQRISLNLLDMNFTNQIGWENRSGPDRVDGSFQAVRRVAGAGISGQIAYRIVPHFDVANAALNFDKMLGDHDRLNVGLIHTFGESSTTLSAGVNHRIGNFALGMNGFFSSHRNYGIGLTLFTAFGHDPANNHWIRDWQPMAGTGFIAARAFLDANDNQRFDAGEEPVPRVSFAVNGVTRSEAVTNAAGRTLLRRVPTRSFANIAIDPASLEDIQWQPGMPGVRALPRAGHPVTVDLPIVVTSEIEGTVLFADGSNIRGIGNAKLELVGRDGVVMATTKSASDGYFVLSGIRPGEYEVRISPEQLASLKLNVDKPAKVTIGPDNPMISSVSITVRRN